MAKSSTSTTGSTPTKRGGGGEGAGGTRKSPTKKTTTTTRRSKKDEQVTSPEVEPKVIVTDDDDGDDDDGGDQLLPYGLSDEDEEEEKGSSSSNGRMRRSKVLEIEEDFYEYDTSSKKKKKQQQQQDYSHCQRISPAEYDFQADAYTREAIDNLSRQIRRHPNLAAKCYRFLHRGISIKLLHQTLRIVVSLLFAMAIVAIIIIYPLPKGMENVMASPTTSSIFDSTGSIHLNSLEPTHMRVKEGWTRFATIGISNYLCGNYNDNPLMNFAMMSGKSSSPSSTSSSSSAPSSPHDHEMKNLKIFGACLVSGVSLFVLWLIAMKLSDREIVLHASLLSQLAHVFMTLIFIPLASMIFWAMFILYFVQTVLMGAEANQEDTFRCVNRLSTGIRELGTFSPIRELTFGSLGLISRVLVGALNVTPSQLSLHDLSQVTPGTAQLISFLWSIVIGSTIYYFLKIVSNIYSIFRDNSQMKSARTIDPDQQFMLLDLKFIPSFIPRVVTTQNFFIVCILSFVSFILWIFGTPNCVHEGEIFYVVLALLPLVKSLYNILVIEQKKHSLPETPTFEQDPDLIKNPVFSY